MTQLSTSNEIGKALLAALNLRDTHCTGVTLVCKAGKAAVVQLEYAIPQGALQPVLEHVGQFELVARSNRDASSLADLSAGPSEQSRTPSR